MATKLWAIGVILLATVLTSTGQVLYKLGADKIIWSDMMTILTNYWIIIGAFVYLASAALLLIALKGGELSVLYPFVATSYVWVSILSATIFREAVGTWKWAGVGLIILGVTSIGIGSKR
ncbi:MAG: hypothetical protein KJ709_06500 [Nanoarchaeota archaeon]|nr:hypothetical protein [Nanoarchaeota archaeon]